ncbi:MAG: SDR family oxidoreductase [Candidatus Binataceae bacterium]|nr:SDR family oxidoreductase [Candidatus Binataceae bacterium]
MSEMIDMTLAAGLLEGSRCLVMAGADGIGEAIANRFRSEGAAVHQTGGASGTGSFCRVEDVAASFTAARAALGKLNLVVLAYSQWSTMSPEKWSTDRFQELMASNAAMAVETGRLALREIEGSGALCFISTDWALATSPDLGLMGASKAPLGPITKSLALHGAKRGLRVNAIFMGLIDSPQLRAFAAERGAEAGISGDAFERLVARVPIGRAGTPDEIAKATAFICSPRSRHVTGVSVLVDGGLLYA